MAIVDGHVSRGDCVRSTAAQFRPTQHPVWVAHLGVTGRKRPLHRVGSPATLEQFPSTLFRSQKPFLEQDYSHVWLNVCRNGSPNAGLPGVGASLASVTVAQPPTWVGYRSETTAIALLSGIRAVISLC